MELWRRDAGAEKIEAFLAKHGSLAASTSTTDGERVIVYFVSCGRITSDFAGKDLWRHAVPVVAAGHICIVNLDGKAATLTAGKKLVVVRRTDLAKGVAAPPAIVDDTLFVSAETKLCALRAGKKQGGFSVEALL